MEDLGNTIKYIVNRLTVKGFSVGCYCIDNCIYAYVLRGQYHLTSVLSLTTLNEVDDKQYCIDYFIYNIIEQFNEVE